MARRRRQRWRSGEVRGEVGGHYDDCCTLRTEDEEAETAAARRGWWRRLLLGEEGKTHGTKADTTVCCCSSGKRASRARTVGGRARRRRVCIGDIGGGAVQQTSASLGLLASAKGFGRMDPTCQRQFCAHDGLSGVPIFSLRRVKRERANHITLNNRLVI